MTNLLDYFDDGANAQAQAVMCLLKHQLGDGIEESWNDETNRYDANIKISRWENCREQGYVVILKSKDYNKQLNIAFFEHRNSDDICAVKWNQKTINAPTIDTANFGNIYKDKYDVSHSVRYGEIKEMSDWIMEQLIEFWEKTSKKPEKSLEIP